MVAEIVLNDRPWYNYLVEEYMVKDGDTVHVVLDLGFHSSHHVNLRVMGVDAPETRFLYSREAGKHVQAAVDRWMLHFWNGDLPLVVQILADRHAHQVVHGLTLQA